MRPESYRILFSALILILCACSDPSLPSPSSSGTGAQTIDAPSRPKESAELASSTPIITLTAPPAKTEAPTPALIPTETPTSPLPTPTALPTTTPSPLSQGEAEAALLTLEAFPREWSVGGPGSIIKVETDDTYSFLCKSMERRTLLSVTTTFRNEAGLFLTHAILVYPTNAAPEAMAALREAAETCDSWEAPLHFGSPVPMHVVPSSFPAMGDDSLHVRTAMDGESDAVNFPTDSIFIRRADTIIFISQNAQNLEMVDDAQLEELAQKALEKLDAVLASRS